MVDISIVNGIYKPTYNQGAPHCITGMLRSHAMGMVEVKDLNTGIEAERM